MVPSNIGVLRRKLHEAILHAQTSEYPVAILDLQSLQECLILIEDRYGYGEDDSDDDESMDDMLDLRDGE
ncbi:MAG: hypothetical protein OES09_11725 [Gammaproteobacteria bacterium]|nr:hypothetical protein [Gammaproteobacteria bacterium]